MENMLTIGVIVYDGNYECIFNIYNQIQEHVKLSNYEVLIADNREQTKKMALPSSNVRVIDMGINRYTLEGRRAITENAYGNYIWLIDADDEICQDLDDSIWLATKPDVYFLPTEVNHVVINSFTHMPIAKKLSDMYVEDFGTFMWDKFFKKDILQEVYRILPRGDIIFCEDDITNYIYIWIQHSQQITGPVINLKEPLYKHNPNKYSISLNEVDENNSDITTIGSSEMLCFIYTIDPRYWAYIVLRASRFLATRKAVYDNGWMIGLHMDDLFDFAKNYNKFDLFKNIL